MKFNKIKCGITGHTGVLGSELISWLKQHTTLQLPTVNKILPSDDGTIKFLIQLFRQSSKHFIQHLKG